MREDWLNTFELVFKNGLAAGLLDRPAQIVFHEIKGLPKGTFRAVLRAYEELVEEGCLAVFGPHISDNALPLREAIETSVRVPAISVTGTEDWLGEWTFMHRGWVGELSRRAHARSRRRHLSSGRTFRTRVIVVRDQVANAPT